ncbi:MAG: hypothetical protein R3B09_10980 [Nannocystaceae bacterium]
MELAQRKNVEEIRLDVWQRRSRLGPPLATFLLKLPKLRLAKLCHILDLDPDSSAKTDLAAALVEFIEVTEDEDDYDDEFEEEGDEEEEDEGDEDEEEEDEGDEDEEEEDEGDEDEEDEDEEDEDEEDEDEEDEDEEDEDEEDEYEEEDEDDEEGDLTEDEEALLEKVPEDGSSIGNSKLRRLLHWDEDDYWEVRDSLVEKGYLAVGFGRGGSVYRLFEEEEEEEEEDDVDDDIEEVVDSEADYDGEESLYTPIAELLERNWQQLFPGFPTPAKHWVDSSPRQGRRQTGGRWTRPDLSAVTLNKYRYVPGPHIDVFTFEVKPRSQFNVLGLYEALGHSRRANFAYVLYHVRPEGKLNPQQRTNLERQLEEIKREAARLRVGVATFEDPAVADTWTVHVLPGRHAPEARLLNEFIETLPEKIRKDMEFYI